MCSRWRNIADAAVVVKSNESLSHRTLVFAGAHRGVVHGGAQHDCARQRSPADEHGSPEGHAEASGGLTLAALRLRLLRWLLEASDIVPTRCDPRFDDELRRSLRGVSREIGVDGNDLNFAAS